MSIKEMIRETAQEFHDAGLMDSVTARSFAHLGVNAVPETYSAKKIAKIRETTKMSQDAFASLLNISKRTVQNWEQGNGTPSALGRKLLELVDRKGAEALF